MPAYPGHYALKLVYAMPPFTVPDKMRAALNKFGPSFPIPTEEPMFSIATLGSMAYISDDALIRIFNDPETFKETWEYSSKQLSEASETLQFF